MLSSAGGSSVIEAARRVMRKLMTTEVALKLNWMGKRGKVGFAAMDLKQVVFGELKYVFFCV